MGKPAKPAVASGAKDLVQHKELFVLKYLRFTCADLEKTREFYLSVGMSIEYQIRSTNKTPATTNPSTPSAPTTALDSIPPTTEGISKHTKTVDELPGTLHAVDETKKDELESRSTDSPNLYKTDLCLSFATPSNASPQGGQCLFQLIFSYVSSQKPVSEDGSRTNSRSAETPPPAPINFNQRETKKRERNQEYLVIYVHLLPRIIKRLAQKGFKALLAPTAFRDAQIAILEDPNGIEIRLIELTDVQHDDPSVPVKRQWFARVGYYTIPSVKLDQTTRFYERMFSYVGIPAGGHVPGAGGTVSFAGGPTKKDKKGKKGAAAAASTAGENSHGNTCGVRLIDQEDFVVGLTKTQFNWFSHEPRSLGAAICFTGKVLAEAQEIRPIDRSESLLLGIGIEVPSLDGLLKRWEWERPNEVIWEPGRTRVPGIGQYCRFRDPNNDIFIEVFTPKIIDPNDAIKEAAALAASQSAEKAAASAAKKHAKLPGIPHDDNDTDATTASPPKSRADRRDINKSYLGGLAKSLSEGAIQIPPLDEINSTSRSASPEKKTPTNGDAKPAPHTIKVKMQKLDNTDDIAITGRATGAVAATDGLFEDIEEVGDAAVLPTGNSKLGPQNRPKSRSAKF